MHLLVTYTVPTQGALQGRGYLILSLNLKFPFGYQTRIEVILTKLKVLVGHRIGWC